MVLLYMVKTKNVGLKNGFPYVIVELNADDWLMRYATFQISLQGGLFKFEKSAEIRKIFKKSRKNRYKFVKYSCSFRKMR